MASLGWWEIEEVPRLPLLGIIVILDTLLCVVPSIAGHQFHSILCELLFVLSQGLSRPSPGCPGTHSVDQADLELIEICLLSGGLKECATTPSLNSVFENVFGILALLL